MEKHWIICLMCNKTFLQVLKLKYSLVLLGKIQPVFAKCNLKKVQRERGGIFSKTSCLYYHHWTATTPFWLFRNVLTFSSFGMEIKTSTLEVLVVHSLQFSLWKPSYLLTESLCTKTSSLACPAVCSAHLWERLGFDKNHGNVFLLTWGGNHIQQEYSAFQSERSPSTWQIDTQTSQQEPLATSDVDLPQGNAWHCSWQAGVLRDGLWQEAKISYSEKSLMFSFPSS